MNLPSVDLYFKVGRENLLNTCDRLEFPRFRGDAPSIALGTLDVSLYEAVRAYGAFANEGRMNELFMIRKITDAKGKVLYKAKSPDSVQVFDSRTTGTITAILQQVINQGTGAGIRSRYGIQSDLAGKTGTAQNFTDAWFLAYTPGLVAGTWVGASKPDIHFFSGNGSGAALAMPVAAGILKNIENNPGLKSKYLVPFSLPQETYAFLQCDPYHETGVKGFFNRLFSSRPKSETDTVQGKPKEKEKPRDIRSLIRRIFRGE
jgi:penicillin-binding protein 1A